MLIHALDPVYIAIKASYTSIRETINLADVIHGTISGIDGVGGIETLGMYRVGLAETKNVNWSESQPYNMPRPGHIIHRSSKNKILIIDNSLTSLL